MYKTYFDSKIGKILLMSNGIYITNLEINNDSSTGILKDDLEIFKTTKKWLTKYFDGEIVDSKSLSLKLDGTDFQKEVWKILMTIPYGKTTTYGSIAKIIAKERNIKIMSSQAVGNAIHNNPIPIIIPCHRVIGKDGNLTGFGCGMDIKIKLLEIEKVDMSNMYVPKKESNKK